MALLQMAPMCKVVTQLHGYCTAYSISNQVSLTGKYQRCWALDSSLRTGTARDFVLRSPLVSAAADLICAR